MAKRIAVSTLNASTLDILNVIRQNASLEYQSSVPTVTQATDIPKVGEIIYGTPALANQFINALVNRIALVKVQSATFNNPYSHLKKGMVEFGESVEEIFVNIAKVETYTPEKAESREFKRTLPDVRSAFHIMNWRVMYPVTIQDEDLRLAFLSIDGVTDLIAKIVEQVYTAYEYDEFLLFKYLLIKGIAKGQMKPVAIGNGSDLKVDAVQYRGVSNDLTFMHSNYNASGVKTTTPKERQCIFMDSFYNAQFDVDVLASAFNMEKADFMGRLHLIDNFTSFDNERFEVIRAESDGIEAVTDTELALLANVKAVIVDEEWFQIYDNMNKMTEKYVSSGLYWNYFYHTWKTISSSPFANAVVFVTPSGTITAPSTLTGTVKTVDKSADGMAIAIDVASTAGTLAKDTFEFEQTKALVEDGIAVQKYGEIIIPTSKLSTSILTVGNIDGVGYTASSTIKGSTVAVGDTITLAKDA